MAIDLQMLQRPLFVLAGIPITVGAVLAVAVVAFLMKRRKR